MKPLEGAEKEKHMFRSLLYMPASSERFVARAHERGADAIILDLEDSVASREKERARGTLAEAVPSVSRNGAKAFVRINSEPELMFADAEAACRAGAFGIFVPKTRRAADLVRLDEHLDKIERGMLNPRKTLLVPMIEDAGAVLDARGLAAATSRTLGLITGGEDLATAMGAEPTPKCCAFRNCWCIWPRKQQVCSLSDFCVRWPTTATSRASSAPPRKPATSGLTAPVACIRRSSPFSTKLSRLPPRRSIALWRLIAAYDQSVTAGQGACVFEGKMIDAPVVARARALVAKWVRRGKSSQVV